jgi:hypothetical protein
LAAGFALPTTTHELQLMLVHVQLMLLPQLTLVQLTLGQLTLVHVTETQQPALARRLSAGSAAMPATAPSALARKPRLFISTSSSFVLLGHATGHYSARLK